LRAAGTLYCDICGSPIQGRPVNAEVDGAEMILCLTCYMRLSRSGKARAAQRAKKPAKPRRAARRARMDHYDLVEDYYERIREAREAKGWTTEVLAQKLRISEAMLRKIESGRVKPSIDLARKIEKLLNVKLLEPVVEEEAYYGYEGSEEYLTLGDIVVVDRDEE
jgi:putative transcription factor